MHRQCAVTGKVTNAVGYAAQATANALLVQHIIYVPTMSATIDSEENSFLIFVWRFSFWRCFVFRRFLRTFLFWRTCLLKIIFFWRRCFPKEHFVEEHFSFWRFSLKKQLFPKKNFSKNKLWRQLFSEDKLFFENIFKEPILQHIFLQQQIFNFSSSTFG